MLLCVYLYHVQNTFVGDSDIVDFIATNVKYLYIQPWNNFDLYILVMNVCTSEFVIYVILDSI